MLRSLPRLGGRRARAAAPARRALSAGGRPRVVLGIETSCDETAMAVVTEDRTVLADVVASQVDLWKDSSGVVPATAMRAHQENLPGVLRETLAQSGLEMSQVDAVAVSAGPGLPACLDAGLGFAKGLATEFGKPFVAVNHLEAHLLLSRLLADVPFPFIGLLVSGGHTQLVRARGVGQYDLLGQTLDDAAGEAFDKVCHMLRLNKVRKPGEAMGATLERVVNENEARVAAEAAQVPLTVPLAHKVNLDFSFAGLKANVRREVESTPGWPDNMPEERRAALAVAFHNVAVQHLKRKTLEAVRWARHQTDAPHTSHLVVSGGVAANGRLTAELDEVCLANDFKMWVPPPALCGDNGVMVAWAGIEHLRLGHAEDPVPHDLAFNPRWPIAQPLEIDYSYRRMHARQAAERQEEARKLAVRRNRQSNTRERRAAQAVEGDTRGPRR